MQGGLIGLAAATVGLASEAAQHLEVCLLLCPVSSKSINSFSCETDSSNLLGCHGYRPWSGVKRFKICICGYFFSLLKEVSFDALQKIVPPVLNSFTDQDSRVRYYACEALYNIAKVNFRFQIYRIKVGIVSVDVKKVMKCFVCSWFMTIVGQVARGDFIVFFNDVFDALCKLSADSDPNVQSAAHLLDRLVKVLTSPVSDDRSTHLCLRQWGVVLFYRQLQVWKDSLVQAKFSVTL
jgi:hypothetical protein